MGKSILTNWFVNNPFFQTAGQFSKTAFICMTTWLAVMVKFIFAGLTLGMSSTQYVLAGKTIPAFSFSWVILFDMSSAIALLTLVFGLYFGGKFAPTNTSTATNGATVTEIKK